MEIHPTAIVSPRAELADDVEIRAYSIIGPDVVIGPGSVVGPHAVIDGRTTIGARNQIFPFASIGHPPQDISYRGEETRVVMGDGNIIREGVTIHRGTERGGGVTTVGSNCLIMAYAHVAHDCTIGSYVIMANAALLGGHVCIDDYAIVGGMVAVHQFVHIGMHAFIGGKSGVGMDVPPYMLAVGERAKLYGPNTVGLKRKNFAPESILTLKRAFKMIFRSNLPFKEAMERARTELPDIPEMKALLDFISRPSNRGLTR
ncbi:MAG: acyl-ACP--UDP-N-acetylglucosamine O-acyltransferase [Syntrophobacteraceae bacterium]